MIILVHASGETGDVMSFLLKIVKGSWWELKESLRHCWIELLGIEFKNVAFYMQGWQVALKYLNSNFSY